MTEQHAYTSRFHRLVTIRASGNKLAVPEGWIDGVTPQGIPWVGDPDGDCVLQMVATAKEVPGGVEALALAMESRANELARVIGERGQVDDIGVLQGGATLLISAVIDDTRMPDKRTRSWIRLEPHGEGLSETSFYLTVRLALWDQPQTKDLMELFEAQLRNNSPSEQPADVLDFERLRTINPFGFLSLQIPARWRDERDAESGEWFCGEDETDTGTLWIDYDSFAGTFDARGPERLFQKLGDTVTWRPPGEGWRRIGYQSFTEDAAVTLRFHRWFVIDWTAGRAVMVTLTLCLQADWDGEPAFQRLVEIVERQAATLGIGALPG